MQFALAALALAAGASSVAAQAQGSCSDNYPTTFTFQTMNVTTSSKRSIEEDLIEKRQSLSCGKSVTIHLGNGVLNDGRGRTGYIASNDQFQFDAPPQAGYKQTSGWSVCTLTADNQRLALDGNEIFYNCLSGTFNNIYTSKQGQQCYEVYIQVFGCIPESPIPTAPINTVPAPKGSASFSEASGSASATAEAMTYSQMTSMPSAPPMATPYPAGNASTPMASTGMMSTPAVTPVTGPTMASSPAASKFTGAANMVEAGSKVVGLVAGLAAFAMF